MQAKQHFNRMVTATLPLNGVNYLIPNSDVAFFTKLAKRMKWHPVSIAPTEKKSSWIDEFAGKWQDTRSAEEIIADIYSARTKNEDIVL